MTDLFQNPNYRKSVRTQYQLAQAAQAIRDGLIKLGVQTPSDITVAKLLSQARLETGSFRYCWNNNWGNVKRNPGKGPYHMIRCNEVINGVLQWFDPPHIQCCFASYDTQTDGAIAWMGLMIRNDRYNRTEALLLNDAISARDFVWQLGVDGYYTANKTTYSNSVQTLFASSLAAVQGGDHSNAPVVARPGDASGVFVGRRLLELQVPRLTGADVLEVQTKLKRLGFYTSTLDGEYGTNTAAAVKAFQGTQVLKPDGECGTDTYAALAKL